MDNAVFFEKLFVGRKKEISLFKSSLKQNNNNFNFFNFYGLSGIGKTSLLKNLEYQTSLLDGKLKKDTLVIKVDLENYDLHKLSRVLLNIKHQLELSKKITFHRFDLAYTIYLEKMNPGFIPNPTVNKLSFIEDNFLLKNILNDYNLQKYVNFYEFLSKKISQYKDDSLPWSKNIVDIVEKTREQSTFEIENSLFQYLIEDIQKNKSNKEKQIIFLVDSFHETATSSKLNKNDYSANHWLYSLLTHSKDLEKLIKITWVVNSRVRMTHHNIVAHELCELSVEESREFLGMHGIKNNDDLDSIVNWSHKIPYLLSLIADYKESIDIQKLSESTHHFSNDNLSNKILSFTSLHERETLKILSLPNSLDLDLCSHLIRYFNTGFPLTAFSSLLDASYIDVEKNGRWKIKSRLREELRDELEGNHEGYFFKAANQYIKEYYIEKLNKTKNLTVSEKHFFLEESVFHALFDTIDNKFIAWYCSFIEGNKISFEFSMIAESLTQKLILNLSNKNHLCLVFSMLANLSHHHGNYRKAIAHYKQALSHFDENPSSVLEISKIKIKMSDIYRHTTEYISAKRELLDVIDLIKNSQMNKLSFELICNALIQIGKIEEMDHKYNNAIRYYKSSLKYCKDGLKKFPNSVNLLVILAMIHEKLGEVSENIKDTDLFYYYDEAFSIYENLFEFKSNEIDTNMLKEFGLLCKRIAERHTEPLKKELFFEKSLDTYEVILAQSPTYIECLERKGHTLADFLIFKIKIGDFETAHFLFEEARSTFEKIEKLAPLRASSLNRHASLYAHYSELYIAQNNYKKALELLTESLAKFSNLQNIIPLYKHLKSSSSSAKSKYDNLIVQNS